MRPVPRKWAVPLLLLLTAGLVFALHTADSNFGYEKIFSLDGVEMTPQEELDAWLEEQAQAAKKFYGEHEELFHQIAQAALDPEVADAYQGFTVGSGYSEPERLYLAGYRTAETGGVTLGFGAYPDGEYYRSISDLSPALEPVLEELLALRQPLYLTYTGPEDPFYYGDLLEIGYSNAEFPTAIYCNVDFQYDPEFSSGGEYDLGDGWHIQTDCHFMYGL